MNRDEQKREAWTAARRARPETRVLPAGERDGVGFVPALLAGLAVAILINAFITLLPA